MIPPSTTEPMLVEQNQESQPQCQEYLEMLVDRVITVEATAQRKRFQKPEGAVSEVIFEAEIAGMLYSVVCNRPASRDHLVLSPREQEIARLVAKGHSNKSIGDILEISSLTVGTHLRRIFLKMGVATRAALVARMLEG
jgi:two-component system, NarL family, nitrate/nitrite response regulator NarL